MNIEDFHFLRPWWLLSILPLLYWVWLWIKKTQRGSGWESAIDSQLLSVLIDASHIRSGRLLGTLLLVAITAACIGLAGPTWEKLPQSVEQKNDALIILLDLSLSMLAQDTKPSRIERARQEVTDILRLRQEGQTALVAYAGDAHVVVPLTDDTSTITNLLTSLSPEMMPVYGSNPNHALSLAAELFENSSLQQGRMILITDGIDDISSVSRHADRAFPISILGIGTEAGGPIPLDLVRQPGRYLQTQEGNQIVALLDQTRLAQVAALTHGRYAAAQFGDADINFALTQPLPGEDDTIEVEREFDTWFDQGHWVTLILLPLMLLLFRKGVLVCTLIVFSSILPAPPAQAGVLSDTWEALWLRDNQRAHKALRHGQPEKAISLFDDSKWAAIAQYRSGDYAAALKGFDQDDSVTGRYNQANSQARLAEYQVALDLYKQVLAIDPSHEDALFNKELVERLLEEQQNQQQQQNQEQQSQANNEDSESQQNNQQDSQDQSEQDEQGTNPEQQKEQSSEQEQQNEQQGDQQTAQAEQDDETRDEKQDALEQWLRRVPDDPGGLIRRKFSHETKQRLRRGEYENRQGEKLW
ncbi:MAG: VWA domain-containing protein [Gammaproteobacteria bacterium]|nr:VWA domain-containing protein [Gammaproteobacteria bacterium]